MVRLNGKEYSGYVADSENGKLTVIIHTIERFDDVTSMMIDVKEVINIRDGLETAYHITVPISARVVTNGIYLLEFSTKPTYKQEMEAKIQEQSDAIDDLLVMILEG